MSLSQHKFCHLSALVLFFGEALPLPFCWMMPEATPLLGTFASTALFKLNWCWDAKNIHVPSEQGGGKRGACFDCTRFCWPPSPGSKSLQSLEHVMHLHELQDVTAQETHSWELFLPPVFRYNCHWLWLIVGRVLPAVLHADAGCQWCLHKHRRPETPFSTSPLPCEMQSTFPEMGNKKLLWSLDSSHIKYVYVLKISWNKNALAFNVVLF